MTVIVIKALLIVLSGYLWRKGGQGGFKNAKLLRRLGCPIAIGLGAALTKNWFGLLSLPLLFGAFTLGYYENSKLYKVFKNLYIVRFICGLTYALASIFIIYGNWVLFGWHLFITSLGVMLAGNQKFNWEDKREEFYIGMLVALHPLMGA